MPGPYRRISRSECSRTGFTLVELLVVMLILAILVAIALPLYLSGIATSERNVCVTNMKAIATACQAYKTKFAVAGVHRYPSDGDFALITGPDQDLIGVPLCPTAGSYTWRTDPGSGALTIYCTSHGSYAGGQCDPGGTPP